MSEETKTKTSHIRTFANDMKVERKKHGLMEEGSEEERKVTDSKKKKPTVTKAPVVTKLEEQKAAEGKESVPHIPSPTPKKIPAFHELKKKQEPITKEKIKPVKKVPKPKKIEKLDEIKKLEIPNAKDKFAATVITDTKHKRFKFFPSVFSSFSSWFKNLTTSRKKKAPKYTIPEANRRKGVIQKATSKTGTVFTADNETLKEQIRLRRIMEKKEQEEKAPTWEDDPDTTWSPYTETGFNLLESPEKETPSDKTDNVTVEFKKRSIPKQQSEPIQKSEVDLEDIPVPEPETKELAVEPEDEPIEEVLNEEIYTDNTPEEEGGPEEAEFYEETSIIDNSTTDAEIQSKEDINKSLTKKLDTNTLTLVIVASLVGLFLVVFVGKVAAQYIGKAITENDSSSVVYSSIINSSNVSYITLNQQNVNQLSDLLLTRTPDTQNEITEFVIISETGTVITPSNVFNTLGFNVTPSLHRSLTDVRFISTPKTSNLILIKFVDETTVQGGLLYWEQNLAADVSKIFSLPDETDTSFTDMKVSGVDVRALKSDDDLVLFYGIIDENTALIATEESEFSKVVELGFTD